MPDLLLELFSEEIPARMQAKAAEDLRKLVTDALVEAGLVYEGAKAFATPRRLALTVHGLPARSPDRREEKKGPRVGAPEKAIDGFLKSAGLASIDQAKVQQDKKGDFYLAVVEQPGRPAPEVIAEIVPRIVRAFPWPKAMRWGPQSAKPGSLTWVRPLQSILCVFGPETEDTEVVPFEIDGIRSGNVTRGHRFMAPGEIEVRRFEDYAAKLEKAKVVLDADRRREIVLADARNAALAANLELVEDDGLLEEVAGLVEWPVVLMGSFDAAFLELPPEVVRTTIRNNQKCFVLRRGEKLAPNFILVANIEARDGGKQIVAGNGRVIRARLSDARYFWETDLKPLPGYEDGGKPLDQRLSKLKALNVVFHEKLGTQGARVERIARLAKEIAPLVGADPAQAERAALLAKADLTTEMVGEFPELQGLMGRYYALAQGEDASVAAAIEDHYKPLGPADRVPTDPVAIAVALADKLDTLVGFWAIDEKPTGSKDPYALRRAALGVIRLVLASEARVRIRSVIEWSVICYVFHGFRPTAGYRSLAEPYDPQYGNPPSKSWIDPPFKSLLNGDGFLESRRVDAGMSQIGNPDLGSDPESDEEAGRRHHAFQELQERLGVLDGLLVHVEFENVEVEGRRLGAMDGAVATVRKSWLSSSIVSLGIDLLAFFADRLKVQLREQGARHDLVDAVFAMGQVASGSPPLPGGERASRLMSDSELGAKGEGARLSPSGSPSPHPSSRRGEGADAAPSSQPQDDLLLIVRRVEALGKFLDTDDGAPLLAGVKRAANILREEEKKSGEAYDGAVDPKLLTEPEEKALFEAIGAADGKVRAAVEIEDFAGAMTALAALRAPVDAFFDKVRVNADDPAVRANRLRLLNRIREATLAVADFSKVGG